MFAVVNVWKIKRTLNIRKFTILRPLCVVPNLDNDQKIKQQIPEKNEKIQLYLERFGNDILYSGYVEDRKVVRGFVQIKKYEERLKKNKEKMRTEPLPLTLKLLYNNASENVDKIDTRIESDSDLEPVAGVQFPFVKEKDVISKIEPENNEYTRNESSIELGAATISHEIKARLELLNKPLEQYTSWMKDYESFEGPYEEDEEEINVQSESINYGTPNPKIPVSKVACGGCGAHLHCKDTSIPGYIPSEIFLNARESQSLQSVVCQRCFFLKEYNLALQVNVTPSDYLKVLNTITLKPKALVILLVDLLDFPCSIWPGIADLLGKGRPVLIVGNKVDLLPQDGKGFFLRVTNALEKAVNEAGFGMKNILDIVLISAKTGFGIETLVTRLFHTWQNKGDVYLVGCTNSGKSSLYNALLQSDFCKTQATPLMQRATTSPWPGTTLHLLKFPITRPDYHKISARTNRLREAEILAKQEIALRRAQLKKTKNQKFASLIGHVGQTFKYTNGQQGESSFGMGSRSIKEQIGIDENHPDFKLAKWCYDTPGVVQQDQITDLLTTDELLLTHPREIIRPRTFTLRPGHTIFIAGLARLDYINGPSEVTQSTRFTVFASRHLPVTVCKLERAEEVYRDGLESGALEIPNGSSTPERLKVWKGLEKCKRGVMIVTGIDNRTSCADVVLSSVGWIAITPALPGLQCTVAGWTPEGRGIYLREESLLPNAVFYRGKRIRGSVAYTNNMVYYGEI